MCNNPFQPDTKNYYFSATPEELDMPQDNLYVAGYGFAQTPLLTVERHRLRVYCNGIGAAFLGYFLLGNLLPLFLYRSVIPLLYVSGINYNQMDTLGVFEAMDLFSYVISLFLPFFLYRLFIHMPLSAAMPTRKPALSIALPSVFVGLGASCIGIYSSLALSALAGLFGYQPHSTVNVLPDAPLALGIYLLRSTLMAALVEEFVFRGAILQSLRRFGDGFALLISSLLFALAHGNLIQGPNAFLMGMVIGYFVIRTGSIWTGILIHFCNNLFAVLFDLLAQNLSNWAYQAANDVLLLVYLILGIGALLYLIHRQNNLFTLSRQGSLLANRIKYTCALTSPMLLVSFFLFGMLTFLNMSYVG